MNTKQKGKIFEKKTVDLLKHVGFRNIQFSSHRDSYDLTAEKNNKKYFIEVRYVRSGEFSLNEKVINLLKLKKNKQVLFVLWSKDGHVIKSLDEIIEERGKPIPRNKTPKNYKNSVLTQFLGPSPKLRVIDFLIGGMLFDYSKKEIIEGAGISKTTFFKIWKDFIKFGIVKPTRKYGKAQLYSINKENILVRQLLSLEFALANEYTEKISKSKAILVKH